MWFSWIYNLSRMQDGFQWNMITRGSQRYTTCPGKFQTPSFLNLFIFFRGIFLHDFNLKMKKEIFCCNLSAF
jgi:hypothetical protein